jgi:MULE transposase domain
MGILERNGFHPRVQEEYILVDGVRTRRVIREIFFMSSDQILKARRFVSGFMYETDVTFNTNKLRLLLLVMVGIDNTGKTFPMAFMYHTTESAKAFKFTSEQLTDLAFYDCLEAAVICGDFSKGLGATIKLKAF